jgi:type II secretory pathway component PulM
MEEKKQIAIGGGMIGLVVVLYLIGAPDQEACEQAKKTLTQHTVSAGLKGLGERLQRARKDHDTALSGGSYSSEVDDFVADLQQGRRDRSRQRTREQLKRERDAACSWFGG